MSSIDALRRLPKIQSEISELKAEFVRILEQLRAGIESTVIVPAPAYRLGRASRGIKRKSIMRRSGRYPHKGKKRPASPSGPLAPAVVKVLKAAGKPMKVNAVLEGLKKDQYVFTAKDAKRNLAARIYKLSGVKQVGPGLFAARK